MKKLLIEQQFDVLHVQLPFSPLLAGKIIKYAQPNTKIVGTFHILPYSNLQFAGAKGLSWLTGSALKRFDKIVSVSPGAQEFAKRAMGIDSEVIPNAVDLSAFKVTQPTNQKTKITKTVVFLGRLVQRKGCMELLSAIKLLNDSNQLEDVKLIVAGDGPDRHKLEAYVTRSSLNDKVEFIGRISEQAKPELLASADIVALPSISGESFGIVVVEAIASGAGVVVGGNNPGYSYVLADTPDTLVDPLNSGQFSDKLGQLLNDSTARRKLGDKQRVAIAKFDVNIVGKQILDLYKSLIAK